MLTLENIQREYSMHLANLRMQMLQRSLMFNGMMTMNPSPFYYPSYQGMNLMNQIQSMPAQSKLLEYAKEVKLRAQSQAFETVAPCLESKAQLSENEYRRNEENQNMELDTKTIEKCLKIFEANSTQKPKTEKDMMKKKIEALLDIFLAGSGILTEQDTELIKDRLKHDQNLIPLFESISQRYVKGRKSNDEMQRYTIFRGIKWMRIQIMKRHSIRYSETLDLFVQEYLLPNAKLEESKIVKAYAKQIDEFGKSPRDKNINIKVTKQLLSSQKFIKDFKLFLNHIDKTMKVENDQRKSAFITYLIACLSKNTLPKIQVYKRVPWPVQWMAETKRVGIQVANCTLFEPASKSSMDNFQNDYGYHVTKKVNKGPDSEQTKSDDSESNKNCFDIPHETKSEEMRMEGMKMEEMQEKVVAKLESDELDDNDASCELSEF
eukprot:CAMPEP_0176446214 /NCGR_PEP_ID=MMETSP0127-20121128/24183_1 /TAXON_ID=938130 /ORGANISM="Platyophrya macrostoma, Strain WH" /LENGTH=434 /DNA_ID=CAMNT_0017832187 /DNA_START=42 /DNA_END=1346 /DNA_ORIENTATION=-